MRKIMIIAIITVVIVVFSGCISDEPNTSNDDEPSSFNECFVLETNDYDTQTIEQQARLIEQLRAETMDTDGQIALVRFYGEIGEEDVGQVRDLLMTVSDDPDYGAIVLWIDSPGGGTGSTSAIYDEITKTRSKKPVIAYSSEIIASGGYYISCGADEIITSQDCLIGNIGVIYVHLDASSYYSDFGMKFTVITTGAHKDMGADWRSLTQDEYSWIQDGIIESYTKFVRVVSLERSLTNEKVLELADGRIWTPTSALSDGIIDGIGTLDDALERASELATLEYPNIVFFELWEEGSVKTTGYASPLKYQWEATIEVDGP